VNEVIVAPLFARLVQKTVADPEPAVARTSVGATGTPAGTTDDDAAEAGESPTAFRATTVN
jgi:hypothetical protein